MNSQRTKSGGGHKSVRFTPELSRIERPRRTARSKNVAPKKRRRTRSAPISLPPTHIHRTPSEVKLARDTLHAEYQDVAMYSRLMMGMLHQIQHRAGDDIDKANVHPLLRKSMINIAKTKGANDQELEHHHHHHHHHDDHERFWDVSFIPNGHELEHHRDEGDNDNSDWDMYSPIDNEDNDCSSVASSSLSTQSSNNPKDLSWSMLHDDESVSIDDDDCIFSLDM